MPLKAFRIIPKDLVEWGRWFQDQDPAIQAVIDNNILKGTATFTGMSTKSVTVSETSADYTVLIDSGVNETFFVTSKKKISFTLNSSNATSTAVVRWVLIR